MGERPERDEHGWEVGPNVARTSARLLFLLNPPTRSFAGLTSLGRLLNRPLSTTVPALARAPGRRGVGRKRGLCSPIEERNGVSRAQETPNHTFYPEIPPWSVARGLAGLGAEGHMI